jgi:hypothetical protein
LESKPEVIVTAPEIVGVAVQLVGLIVRVVDAFPRFVEVELTVPRFNTPAESTLIVPELAVWIVRLPEVLVQLDVPPDAKVIAPVELPIPTVFPPVAAKVVLPETVNPPVP